MTEQRDQHERARELLTAVTADPHRDLELTAMAAVAAAILAIADELSQLRSILGMKLG